jgi:lysophospholipase L1-like esterase
MTMRVSGWLSPLLIGAVASMGGALLVQTAKLARAWHIGGRLASSTRAFSQVPPEPRARVLIMGDSTGLGVGAQPGQCLAALLAADRPDAEVCNVSQSGATFADIPHQLSCIPTASEPWDLILLHAGGNDILHGTPRARLHRDTHALLERLLPLARHVVWLGPPNVGLLPAFIPPFSWWLSRRSIEACALYRECADRFGVRFFDFCEPAEKAFFRADPLHYIAQDQIHPSAASYLHCYHRVKQDLPGRPADPFVGACNGGMSPASAP